MSHAWEWPGGPTPAPERVTAVAPCLPTVEAMNEVGEHVGGPRSRTPAITTQELTLAPWEEGRPEGSRPF